MTQMAQLQPMHQVPFGLYVMPVMYAPYYGGGNVHEFTYQQY